MSKTLSKPSPTITIAGPRQSGKSTLVAVVTEALRNAGLTVQVRQHNLIDQVRYLRMIDEKLANPGLLHLDQFDTIAIHEVDTPEMRPDAKPAAPAAVEPCVWPVPVQFDRAIAEVIRGAKQIHGSGVSASSYTWDGAVAAATQVWVTMNDSQSAVRDPLATGFNWRREVDRIATEQARLEEPQTIQKPTEGDRFMNVLRQIEIDRAIAAQEN